VSQLLSGKKRSTEFYSEKRLVGAHIGSEYQLRPDLDGESLSLLHKFKIIISAAASFATDESDDDKPGGISDS